MSREPHIPLLEVKGLTVRFPLRGTATDWVQRRPQDHVTAVDGVDLELRRGELLAIVGESGSGKTTLATAMAHLLDDARSSIAGEVRLDGRRMTPPRGRRAGLAFRRRVQVIYQDPYESLDPRRTAENLLLEPLRIHRTVPRRERRAAVLGALEKVGLTPAESYLQRYPHQLSGGQRQRVAIAAALLLDPEILIADEPVSMLDVSVRAAVLGVLDRLRADGVAIAMITHDLSTAAQYADTIAIMYLGRVVEIGPARAVVDHPRHPYAHALVAAAKPLGDALPRLLHGEPGGAGALPIGCRFYPRCPRGRDDCARHEPALVPIGPAHAAACLHPHP